MSTSVTEAISVPIYQGEVPFLSFRQMPNIVYISTISAAGDLLYISIDLSFNFNLVLYFTCIFFLIFITLWSSWLYPMLQFYVRMSMYMYT